MDYKHYMNIKVVVGGAHMLEFLIFTTEQQQAHASLVRRRETLPSNYLHIHHTSQVDGNTRDVVAANERRHLITSASMYGKSFICTGVVALGLTMLVCWSAS